MDDELTSKVVAIVASVKQVNPATIRLDATFDELGIDSLDRINILFELEGEFDIDIPDEEARSIQTVGGIAERLCAHLQRKQSQGA